MARTQAGVAHGLRPYVARLVVTDVTAVVTAAALAHVFRFGDLWSEAPVAGRQVSYAAVVAAMVPIWVGVIALKGGYDRRHIGVGTEEFRRVADATIAFLAGVAAAAFAFKYDVARGFVAIAIPLAAVLTLAFRYAARRWLHRQRAAGRFMARAVVIGSIDGARPIIECLARSRHTGLTVAAACVPDGAGAITVDGHALPVVGMPDDVAAYARSVGAGAIVVAQGSPFVQESLRDLAWQLEGSGIGLLVAPDFAGFPGPRIALQPIADLPLLRMEEPELDGVRRVAKATVDRVGSALALILLSPLFVLVALAIRLSSGGPVFFRQVRAGIDGDPFTMWKFRTMVVGAEERIDEVRDANEHDGLLFKIRDDPRVTPIGALLRRWSVDELPQLWNVLRGEMSLVGPRPPLPSEVERYSDLIRRRLRVKPGMTGLWQVSGRAQLTWDESIRLDLQYVQNWSPSLDTMIMARTIVAVIRRRGAY